MAKGIEAVSSLVQFVSRGLVSGADVEELLYLLEQVAGANAVAVGTSSTWAGHCLDRGVSEAWRSAYVRNRHYDPMMRSLQCNRPGSWLSVREDCVHLLDDNPTVAEMRPHGWEDCIGLRIPSYCGADHFFAVYRSLGSPVFSGHSRTLLTLAAPHLAACLGGLTASRALAASARETTGQAAARLKYTARFTPGTGEVEWSVELRRWLERRLGRLDHAALAKLAKALEVAAHAYFAGSFGVAVRFVAGLVVDFAYLEPDSTGKVRLLAVAHRSMASLDLPELPAEQLLSPTERKVARLLATGKPVSDVALRCQISVETARTHVRSIYRKLGIETRAELLALYSG